MSALPNPPILTANGDYDFPTTLGAEHMLITTGDFDGATLTLKTRMDANNTFNAVSGGVWTAPFEADFRAPSIICRLSLSSATGSTSIKVAIVKHLIQTK